MKKRGFAQRRDSSESPIVSRLRQRKVHVQSLSISNMPDLLIARNRTMLLEIKTHKGDLTDGQLKALFDWPGAVGVARTPEEALELMGLGDGQQRVVSGLEMGFGSTCRVLALLLAMPEHTALAKYIRAQVDYTTSRPRTGKGSRAPFTETLPEASVASYAALPQALGWFPETLWGLFVRALAQSDIPLVLPDSLSEKQQAAVNQLWLRFATSADSLYTAHLVFAREVAALDDLYNRAEIEDRYRPQVEE